MAPFGGPYPNPYSDYFLPMPTCCGSQIELRDYLAAHAPKSDSAVLSAFVDQEQRIAIFQACAEAAYLWADAMLKARQKPAETQGSSPCG